MLPATLQGTPCPKCKNTTKRVQSGVTICTSCNMTEVEAKLYVGRVAQRDTNGSLLCQTCNDPFPYAEPKEDGSFHCYGCRSTKETEDEVPPRTLVSGEVAVNVDQPSSVVSYATINPAGFTVIYSGSTSGGWTKVTP